MQLFKSLYFGVGPASRHYDLIQLSQMVQTRISLLMTFFTCFKVAKKIIFFKGLQMKR